MDTRTEMPECGCCNYDSFNLIRSGLCPLHAAAPALLAACKAMRAAHEDRYSLDAGAVTPKYEKPQCDEIRAANKLCAAAIAKAEGQ